MAENGNLSPLEPGAGLLPSAPATDPMGNALPSAMVMRNPADTLSEPPAEPEHTDQNVPGGATLGQMARLSPGLQRFAKGTDAAAKSNPVAASQPGGWARALLGGAMNLIGGMGDAAAADTPESSGALGGITRTLAARDKRMMGEKQQQMEERKEASYEKSQESLRAETTQRIAASVRNVYRQEKQDRDESYANGGKFMTDTRRYFSTTEDKDNVTQSQLNQMASSDPNFWKTHTGRATGEEPVLNGNGEQTVVNGKPVFSPLYSISKTDGMSERKHPLTESESKFIENNTGEKLPAGTELGFHEYDNVMVRAGSSRDARQKIEKANDEDMSEAKSRQLNSDLSDLNVQHYMSMVPGEPLTGLYQAQKNAQDHVTAINQMISSAVQKAPNAADSPEVQALQRQRQNFLDQNQKISRVISTGFNEKAQEDYVKMIDERKKEAETERHNKADEAVKQEENRIKASQGDPDALAPLLVDGLMDPSQLSKRASTYAASLNSANIYSMQKYGKPYDIAQAQTDYKFANRGDTQNTLKYLNSLTGGTDPSKGNLAELVTRSNGITRTEFPALNDAAAWARLQTGDPSIVGYRATVTEVADQVAKILQGGGSGNGTSDAKLKQAQDLFANGFTKDQIKEVASALTPLLSNRRDSIIGDNRYLIRQFGKPIAAPQNAGPIGKAADGTQVWKMADGTIQDAQGKKYDPQTGKPQ